jgi:hypothetical protein
LGFWSTSELADLQVNPDRTAIAHEHAVIAAMESGRLRHAASESPAERSAPRRPVTN